MAITPLTVTIDLNPSYKRIPAVYVSQLDNNLRELAITVQDGGVNYDVASSGYDVYVEGTKPDKHGFSYKVTDIGGSVSGSVVTVPVQTQMTAVKGVVETEIVLKSGSDRIGSANFLLVVERAALAEDVDISETVLPAYIDGAQRAASNAEQAKLDAEQAKDTAVEAAETAQQVKDSIPADYTELSDSVEDLNSALSTYIIDNLIAEDGLIGSNATSGITFTNNNDGTISVSGTNTTSGVVTKRVTLENKPITLRAGVTYVLASNSDVMPSADSYRLDIRGVSSIGTIYAFERYKYTAFMVANTGEYSVYMRIAKNYTFPSGFKMRPVLVEGSPLTQLSYEGTKDVVRVATLNCGNFSMGASGNPSGTMEMLRGFKDVFREANADIYMFTEWDEYFDENKETTSVSLFDGLKPYRTINFRKTAGDPCAQMQYSAFPIGYENIKYFVDGESRHLTDNIMMIGKKVVHFICTHLPLSSQTLRITDFNKIINYINDNSIEYAIIGGDFNISLDSSRESEPAYNTVEERLAIAKDDVAVMTNAGLNSLQGYFWGDPVYDNFINTINVNDSATIKILPVDNFFYTQNIELVRGYTIDTTCSDHKALVADFILH